MSDQERDAWGQLRNAPPTPPTNPQQKSDDRPWRLIEKTLLAVVAEQRRARRWRIFFFCSTLVFLALLIVPFKFAAQIVAPEDFLGAWEWGELGDRTQSHLALIRIQGPIDSAATANAENINDKLRTAFEHEQSQAIILLIDSPGGSPVQSSRIYNVINQLQYDYPEKPVYAVIDDLGASAAYYIAAAADAIYANPNSIVGSIGVISAGFGFVDFMREWGIERRLQTAGKNKTFLDPFLPQDANQTAHWQSLLDNIHTHFIASVEQERGDKIQRKEEVYSGNVYSGEQAKNLGLIDAYGDIDLIAREVVQIDNIVDYSWIEHSWVQVLERLGGRLVMALRYSALPW